MSGSEITGSLSVIAINALKISTVPAHWRDVLRLMLICICCGLAPASLYAQDGPDCTTYVTRISGAAVTGIYAAGNTVYAAQQGGLRISTDGGITFNTKTTADGLPANNLSGVHVVGNNVYVGTGGNGLGISTDGGSSFSAKTTANGLGANSVNTVYAEGNTVYVGTTTGLSISTDRGSTFTNKTTANGLAQNNITDVYAVGNNVYAATLNGLSISADGGGSFTTKTTANGLGSNSVLGVFVVGNTVYVATTGGLSISTNGGSSFINKTMSNGLGQNRVADVFVVGNTVYALTQATGFPVLTGGGLSISTDGGNTFVNRNTTNGLGSNSPNKVFVGNNIYVGGNGISMCDAPLPCLLTVTASPASQTITSGGSATLTASGATSYTWSNGSTENPLVLTDVTSATTLSITGTTGACSATASAAISVTATEPPAALSVTSPAIDQPLLVLSTGNCPVTFTGQGWGKRFVITNNSGYVFSTVFRNFSLGSSLTAPGINKPGTYTVTAYGDPGNLPVSYTFSVTGTGCN